MLESYLNQPTITNNHHQNKHTHTLEETNMQKKKIAKGVGISVKLLKKYICKGGKKKEKSCSYSKNHKNQQERHKKEKGSDLLMRSVLEFFSLLC